MKSVVPLLTAGAVLASGYYFIVDTHSAPLLQQLRPAVVKKKKEAHAVLEPAAGKTGQSQVVFKPQAAQRLGIRTTPVREEKIARVRTLSAAVVQQGGGLVARVPLRKSELPAAGKAARVRPAAMHAGSSPSAMAGAGKIGDGYADFALEGAGHGFTPGQPVLVDVQIGEGGMRRIVPRGAVVYDPKGNTWVFVETAPLTFVRARVRVDYMDGETIVLLEGPAAGTAVVSEAVTEVYGAEGKLGL